MISESSQVVMTDLEGDVFYKYEKGVGRCAFSSHDERLFALSRQRGLRRVSVNDNQGLWCNDVRIDIP